MKELTIQEMCEKLLEREGNLMFFWEAIQNKVINVFPTGDGETCVVHMESLDAIREDGTFAKAWEICDCFDKPEEEKEMKYEVEWVNIAECNETTRDGFLSYMFDFTMENHHGGLQDMFEAIKDFDEKQFETAYFTVSEDKIYVCSTVTEMDYERCYECGDNYIILRVEILNGDYTVSQAKVTKKQRRFREVTVTAELLLREDFTILMEVDENGDPVGKDEYDIADIFKSEMGRMLIENCDYCENQTEVTCHRSYTDLYADDIDSSQYVNEEEVLELLEEE